MRQLPLRLPGAGAAETKDGLARAGEDPRLPRAIARHSKNGQAVCKLQHGPHLSKGQEDSPAIAKNREQEDDVTHVPECQIRTEQP